MPCETSRVAGELPADWAMRPIGDLCAILSGGTPPKSELDLWNGDVPWVSGKDMKTARLHDTIDHVSSAAIGAGTRLAPAGSVFLLVRGMGLARDLPVAVAMRPMTFNQDIKALVPKHAGTGPFIRAAIYQNRERLLSRVVPSAHGTMTLNLDDVESFQIAMPADNGEAIAVGKILELVLIKIEHAAVELSAVQRLQRVTKSALFTRGLRGEAQKETELGPLPERWDVVRLGSIGRVGNGSTPKKDVAAYWQGGTFPWLTSAKVYDRLVRSADQFVTAEALRECHLPQVEPGALLIAITGQGKTLGHCAVLGMRATINQHLAYVATDTARADPFFVRGYLETQYDYFRQVGAGGGSTKGALTCAFLRDMLIPFPPLEEQREIAAALDAIDSKIDLHQRKRAVLEDLFEALLHKLMTGEIRVTDLDLSALLPPPEAAAA